MTPPPDAQIVAGLRNGVLLAVAVLALVLPPAQSHHVGLHPAGGPVRDSIHRQLDFAGVPSSPEVRKMAAWVVGSADNGSLPFVILDKRQARLFVFEPGGRLRGASDVLLGHAIGDDPVPGIGERPIEQVRPEERTTPAGRFVSEPGRNARGETVVWVDYGLAVSMHRVLLNNPQERRLERLASPDAAARRISYGCINLPSSFFEEVLWPDFSRRHGIVYVLPEVKALADVFPGLRDAGMASMPGSTSAGI